MIVEIQCLPAPAGTADNPHANVESAIAVIKESGLHHEVGPLGTSVEGEPDQIWPLLRRIHEASLTGTATSAISIIKVAEGVPKGMDELTRKFR